MVHGSSGMDGYRRMRLEGAGIVGDIAMHPSLYPSTSWRFLYHSHRKHLVIPIHIVYLSILRRIILTLSPSFPSPSPLYSISPLFHPATLYR
jgi:hypothetical protein